MPRRPILCGTVATLAGAVLALSACASPAPGRTGPTSTEPATPATSGTATSLPTSPSFPPAPAVRAVSTATVVSAACAGSSAEVENAVDPALGYVYEDWIGCGGIGFARSVDGGRQFGTPGPLPGSDHIAGGSKIFSWDPAIAVAPDGTVYASFMVSEHARMYPVVDVSHDHGVTFAVSPLEPPRPGGFGDRDFVAVDGAGHVYVSWDYSPDAATVKVVCFPGGSCGFTAGEVNTVVQESADGGRTWSPIVPVGPGFPREGGDSGPLLVDLGGRIDLVYQGHAYLGGGLSLGPSSLWFTESAGYGRPWSAPQRLGPPGLTMDGTEWWIDGDIAADAAGYLYATWDTQSPSGDVGWLTFSTDQGLHWSPAQRVTPDTDAAPHIVQVAGGPAGVAYVAFLTDALGGGYALYVRPFSISRGWTSSPVRVSGAFGLPSVWPGDTFGIVVLPAHAPGGATHLALTWGSGVPASGSPPRGEIWAAVTTLG